MSIGIGGIIAIVAGSIFLATTIIIVWSYIRKQKPRTLGAIGEIFVPLLSLIGSASGSSRVANPTATAQAIGTARAQRISTAIAQYYATATVNAIATATA